MQTIIHKLKEDMTVDTVLGMIKSIPESQFDVTVEKTDRYLRSKLITDAESIHLSMTSHQNHQTVEKIKHSFVAVEKYMKNIVRDELPWWDKWKSNFNNFFAEEDYVVQLEEVFDDLRACQNQILVYDGVINFHLEDFSKSLKLFQLWTTALTQFTPSISQTSPEGIGKFYSLSQMINRNAELISAQLQLDATVSLQKQNNQKIAADILYILAITQSLVKNLISVQQFFKDQYIGSMTKMRAYTK